MNTATQQIRSVAETYFEMQNPVSLPAPVVRPTWVPESITESELNEFTKLVIEARTNGESLVEFNGKKYAIAELTEDFPKKDDNKKEDEPKKDDDKKDAAPADDKKDDEKEPDGDENGDDPDGDGEDLDHDGDGVAAPEAPAHPDAKGKAALDADKFESYEQRGASILSVAAAYAEMVNEAAASKAKGGPEVVDDGTAKVVDDSQKSEPVVDDPAKKKPEVKVEKKAEKPEPDASSKGLPDAKVEDVVDAAPELKKGEAPKNATKGEPVATHVGPAVIENPTGAEKISPAPHNQTHPSDAAGAANYPDLQGKSFPSQAKSVIGANESVEPRAEVVTESSDWDDHIAHLSKAAHSMSAHANKTGHSEHHALAADLHDKVHMATAASETDAQNKLSHEHNNLAHHHLKILADRTTSKMHHAGKPGDK